MGYDAVQGRPALFVLIHPLVDVVAQEPPALGSAEGVGALDVPGAGVPGLGRAAAQEGDDVPHGREAQTHHRAAHGPVYQLVDSPRLEARGHVDVARLRLRLRVLHADEGPQVPGDVLGGAVGVFPDRQDGKGIVYVHGGMGQVVPMGEHKDLCGLFDLELAEDPASQAAFGPDGLRRPHPHQARRRRHVRLPSAPHHGVAAAHQVPVAGLYGRRGLRAPLGAVEGPQDGLAPPVDHVEEESVSASIRVRRLEHREVRREADPAVGAPRSELDVGDRLVARM